MEIDNVFTEMFDTEAGMIPVPFEPEKEKGESTESVEEELEVEDVFEEALENEDEDEHKEDKDKSSEGKETKKKDEPKDTKETPSKKSADSSKFPYSTFAKALYEEGIFPVDEERFKELIDETGSEVDALIESFREAVEEGKQSIINDLPDEGKKFLDAIIKGVPINKYISIKSEEAEYTSIDESTLDDDEELCKRLIREDLTKNSKLDKEEIEDQIKDYDSLGKLDTKAKTSLKRLKAGAEAAIRAEKELAERRNAEAVENNKKQMTFIKQEIDKITEIVPGIKINNKLKGELYDAITTPAEQLPNGQYVNAIYAKRAKDPVSWDIKVAYLDKLGVFDGDWSKLISGGKSAAVRSLADKLKEGQISKTGSPDDNGPTPTAKEILEQMRKNFKQK